MNTAPSPCITIYLDDERLQLPAPSAISDLLTHLQRAPESVATALNGRFVAREAREQTPLQDGDQVLLFKAIVGG
jgi:sulfur carrier protein